MSVIGTSPGDPVFWLHHAMVDQLWASWQDCSGTSKLTATTLTAAIGWENVPANSPNLAYTVNMQGYSITAQTAELLNTFPVRYSSTWFQSAFGLNSQLCSNNQLQFLQSLNSPSDAPANGRHLFESRRQLHLQGVFTGYLRKNRPVRSSYSPPASYVNQYQTLYETWKDTYLATNGSKDIAIATAVLAECMLNPVPLDAASLVPIAQAQMMEMQVECATGYCTHPCYRLTAGRRQSTSVTSTTDVSNGGGSLGPYSSSSTGTSGHQRGGRH